ncbi:MAG TPA: hypothetical protein PLO86_04015 [Syntrophales bacterium]|nr:hypothetical protein [Syntrophales bacterium]
MEGDGHPRVQNSVGDLPVVFRPEPVQGEAVEADLRVHSFPEQLRKIPVEKIPERHVDLNPAKKGVVHGVPSVV